MKSSLSKIICPLTLSIPVHLHPFCFPFLLYVFHLFLPLCHPHPLLQFLFPTNLLLHPILNQYLTLLKSSSPPSLSPAQRPPSSSHIKFVPEIFAQSSPSPPYHLSPILDLFLYPPCRQNLLSILWLRILSQIIAAHIPLQPLPISLLVFRPNNVLRLLLVHLLCFPFPLPIIAATSFPSPHFPHPSPLLLRPLLSNLLVRPPSPNRPMCPFILFLLVSWSPPC